MEELERFQRQRDDEEWRIHRTELDEFDKVLRRELKMPTLPWEVATLVAPGLRQLFDQAGIRDYQLGSQASQDDIMRWQAQAQQAPVLQSLLSQLQNQSGQTGLGSLSNNLLNELFGHGSSRNKPS